jgi:HAMP domain-containing protein
MKKSFAVVVAAIAVFASVRAQAAGEDLSDIRRAVAAGRTMP